MFFFNSKLLFNSFIRCCATLGRSICKERATPKTAPSATGGRVGVTLRVVNVSEESMRLQWKILKGNGSLRQASVNLRASTWVSIIGMRSIL